jgi:hypothetical protein
MPFADCTIAKTHFLGPVFLLYCLHPHLDCGEFDFKLAERIEGLISKIASKIVSKFSEIE